MMVRTFSITLLMGLSSTAFAQDLANAPWTADELKTVFHTACVASQPALLERRTEDMAASLGFATIDGDADLTVTSADAALTIAVDGNPIEASCTMTLPVSAHTTDPVQMHGALGALFAELNADERPNEEMISSGFNWNWASDDTYYDAILTQDQDQLTVSLTVSR